MSELKRSAWLSITCSNPPWNSSHGCGQPYCLSITSHKNRTKSHRGCSIFSSTSSWAEKEKSVREKCEKATVCVTIALVSSGPAQMCFIALCRLRTIHLVTVIIGGGHMNISDWLGNQLWCLGDSVLRHKSILYMTQSSRPGILFIFFQVMYA